MEKLCSEWQQLSSIRTACLDAKKLTMSLAIAVTCNEIGIEELHISYSNQIQKDNRVT